MTNRQQATTHKSSENFFRLKPLVAGVRIVIASGFLAGSVTPAFAELPVPVAGGGWVTSGSANQLINGNTLQINQHSDKAILNWQSFNVGKENTVKFVQPSASSVALNRIQQQDPSKILGQITANGQVYLYNQNGFIFGKDSVVDANTLLASTLKITDDVFNRGITRVFDEDGSAALAIEPMKAGDIMDPKTASILIEAGAKIHTDKSGRIIIAAPTIVNKGSLSSDKQGQIILAASQDKVYLQAADAESPFAGLVVEVDRGGKVTNTGDILAKQGNITMAGFAVNQKGRVTATTSLNVNGSIRFVSQEQHGLKGTKLVATKTSRDVDLNDGLGTKAKTTFAKNSLTQIIADGEPGTAIDEQLQPQSYLEVTANTVQLQAGSKIKLPGGKVDIKATDNLDSPLQGTTGRIYVEKGALIDVSGTKGVVVPMERNIAEISVQSYELRDAPLQRTGVLKGQTIKVDIRKDTQIVDTSGATARISRGINERLGKGGDINLTSSGDVVINDGAKIDITGGSVAYQDGYLNTTKLMADYGRIVDISAADPLQHYSAIFGTYNEHHDKWGVKTTWDLMGQSGQFERGYTEGKDAGSFNLKAPLVAWNGQLKAGTDSGVYQRDLSTNPFGGRVAIDLGIYDSLQNIRFQTEASSLQIALDGTFKKVGVKQPRDLILSTGKLAQSGIEDLSVKTSGDVTLVENARFVMPSGSKLTVEAGNINVEGGVKSAGGSLNLKAATNSVSSSAGALIMGKQAMLDVSGLWVNDYLAKSVVVRTDPLAIAGGAVKLEAEQSLSVNKGAVINANGGAWLAANGNLQAGKGGDITLAAIGTNSIASTLSNQGQLSAYGLQENGSLTLASGKIIVGKADISLPVNPLDKTLVLDVANGDFDFSRQLAFNNINLLANFDGLTVKSGVNLDLKANNMVLQSGYLSKATGSSLSDFTKIVELPEHLRNPLQLTMEGITDVVVETGSIVKTDKESTINLTTRAGSIYVDGHLHADAGQINMNIKPSAGLEYDAKQAIWLGEHAKILAQGTTRYNPLDVSGFRSGDVLDGGLVNLSADRGVLVMEAGSLLDVSGISAQMDIQSSANFNGISRSSQNLASNAGKIKLSSADGMFLDGTMQGRAASSTAHGGSLMLSLDRSKIDPPDNPSTPFPTNPLVFNVTQAASRSLKAGTKFGDAFPLETNGQATLSANKVRVGGFSDLSLNTKNDVVFVGDVNLSTAERISIDAKTLSVKGLNGADAGEVRLNTDFLKIGSSLNRTIAESADSGKGLFSAKAQWIDLNGATQWNGFSHIDLNSKHDIRAIGVRIADEDRNYVGALVTAADLDLHASQIYPSTLTDFTFAVKNNAEGKISITGKDTDSSPLAAGGTLTFSAPVINQGGVVKAPLGVINLKATKSLTLGDGSLTSVSAKGQIIPFGVVQGGLDWLYPLDSLRNLVNVELEQRMEKQLVLSAPEINLAKGSVVDVSGGGDLFAYEFQPGAGGSFDYLQSGSASYQGGFAILPSLGSKLAPYDHFESNGFRYASGNTIYLNGSPELAAGEYTILPAHYALLPGAFLITRQAQTQDITASRYTVDGRLIVPGFQKFAGTAISDARSNGYLIENSADVRTNSKYDTYLANQFYQDKAKKNEILPPVLPMDSGQISLIAQNKLIMDGRFSVDALAGGAGAKMDIAANQINVVDQRSISPVAGVLEILDGDLSQLKVNSLLLGGSRGRNKVKRSETDIAVSAQKVNISANTKLQGPEIMVVANELIDIQKGASILADQQSTAGDSVINVKGDGTLLRVSGDTQVVLNRTEATGLKGELRVAAGSTLSATKSMLLDASQTTSLLGDITMKGGSLNLSANAINLGEVDSLGGQDLNLSNQKLNDLTVDELVLNSRGSVNFYGNVGQVDSKNKPVLDKDGLPTAIKFDRLVVNAAGLSGFGASGDAARLEVKDLLLANPLNTTTAVVGAGKGNLDIGAINFTQGAGKFAINGFNAVNLNVTNAFKADGKSLLNVSNDMNVAAGYLTATGGSSFKLDGTGHELTVKSSGGLLNATTPGFGGAIEFIADTIAFDTRVLIPSGKLNLHALMGNVSFGSKTNVDLAGRPVKFADKVDNTPGGIFTAIADNGSVKLAAGSNLDLSSGGGSAKGGQLVLKAPKQTVNLDGQIKATKGSAEIDVARFDSASNFDSLMAVLNNAGINSSIYFRSRDADITQTSSSTINANNLTLVSDKGAVDIFGQLHANGLEQGGNINIYAGDKITLERGSQITANGAQGGNVLLSSTDDDNDLQSGITLKDTALIDVSGKNEGGDLTLRALRTIDGVEIAPIATGVVKGAGKFNAEGVKKYTNADLGNDGQINSADINKIKAETAAYMSPETMQNVANLASGMKLTAGVDISNTGDLSLEDTWDLAGWRYDAVADTNVWDDTTGRLVIKTSGNFNVNKSLSDGFKAEAFTYPGANPGTSQSITIVDKLQGGDSWSYNLVAGADMSSADINTTTQAGNFEIAANVAIRTGSGDMQLLAGGDVNFTDGTSSVYNAGHPTETSPYGNLKDRYVGQAFYAEYPVEGGELAIKAGGNIKGAVATNNDFNDWLFRIGSWANTEEHAGQKPSAWGVALGYSTRFSNLNPARASQTFFRQNVGSFGGGIVSVTAGGNISDLDVLMPTTGKQIGLADNSTTGSFNFLTNKVEVNGGGTMHINAGGDIAGGTYYLGKGVGSMTAGGQVTGGSLFTKGPDFLLGDTQFAVNAGSGASITGVSDPMIAHKADVNFFSYNATSAIDVKSLSGDVVLTSNGSIFPRSNTNSNQQTLARIFPPSLHATAFGGSIELTDDIILYPGEKAELSLFAEQNITSSVGIRLGMSDADITLLPKAELTTSRSNMAEVIGRIDPFGGDLKQLHATTPVHTADAQPARLVTQQGDIENIGFNLAKKALIKSGHDIINLTLAIQQVNEGDNTLIEAVRDIRYTSDRDPTSGSLLGNSAKIVVGGPGEVLVKSGRNIDLGASGGISTLGNVVNTSLAEQGANLTVLAGANGNINYAGFIATYLQGNKQYLPSNKLANVLIADFMRKRLNDPLLSEPEALKRFSKLKTEEIVAIQPALNAIVLPVFFNEIKESGKASSGTGSLGNSRGYAVIEKLFPGNAWKGDLSMFFSKITTIDNGNINLLVPGGLINAGLAVSFTGAKPATELGIVAQREGDINVMVNDDFKVNTSRVFSLNGSDIMIWSSDGDIDAGRGAKSAIAAPPPIVSFDEKGNMKVEFPPIVSGSGIRTASSTDGVAPGDVYLFAPKGVVDAGEAGIGGKNVFIAATAVLGANNIQVSGTGSGVPVASTGSVAAGLTGAGNSAANTNQVAQASAGLNDDDAEDKKKNMTLGMLSVEVLGFGD